ncbi:MAG: Response regulator containing CheY-like receiver, AAA-type ATPase, and DNA-binding domain, partial [Lachnospiraceae bacterium]|nr:Response regulator containing CheY-like receiver, AAA-type ATPase, and DNA-binding domain [Lachnospiraceae bacterium]
MSNKIHVLGIAPYEGMRNIMEKIAADRDDLVLDVYVGDLNKGVEIAQKNFHSNYDVIISRGGTAEMIGQITTIPVIEISLSVYDILRAMKLAENYSDRYAIVGFPGITGSAHLLCDLLQYKTDIFTIHSEEEVQSKLIELK